MRMFRHVLLLCLCRVSQIMAMPAVGHRWAASKVRALIDASPLQTPRYELVDGELLVTPSPNFAHQRAVAHLLMTLDKYLRAHPEERRSLLRSTSSSSWSRSRSRTCSWCRAGRARRSRSRSIYHSISPRLAWQYERALRVAGCAPPSESKCGRRYSGLIHRGFRDGCRYCGGHVVMRSLAKLSRSREHQNQHCKADVRRRPVIRKD